LSSARYDIDAKDCAKSAVLGFISQNQEIGVLLPPRSTMDPPLVEEVVRILAAKIPSKTQAAEKKFLPTNPFQTALPSGLPFDEF
jgi:hypothetical protein